MQKRHRATLERIFHRPTLGTIKWKEIELAFHDSVDEYVTICTERGITPQKPMSGKLSLRISPDLHLKAAAKARDSGSSINALIENALRDAL